MEEALNSLVRLSVLVPVYREPKFLVDIAHKILAYPGPSRELVAVIDGAVTPAIQEALDTLAGQIQVLNPGDHLGKAGALNRAAKARKAEALLFLDNDILLPERNDFLELLSRELETHEIVDVPKEVLVESGYSAMISYEYQGLALASLAFSKIAGRSPGLIGAAFAVQKELFVRLDGFRRVVHEDGDFAARAFRIHARYSFPLKLKVKTSMPNSWRDWVTQRKRWTLINVLWFKENFLHLIASSFKQPDLIPTILLIALPTVLSFVVFWGLSVLHLHALNPFVFMLGSPFQFSAGLILWFSHHYLFTHGLISTALGYLTATVLYGGFCWFGKFRFHLVSFSIFYFLYMPLLVVINLGMFAWHFFRRTVQLEWKT